MIDIRNPQYAHIVELNLSKKRDILILIVLLLIMCIHWFKVGLVQLVTI